MNKMRLTEMWPRPRALEWIENIQVEGNAENGNKGFNDKWMWGNKNQSVQMC